MQGRKKSRSRLAGVRLGRSPAGPSSPSRRGGSGSAGLRLRLAVRPAQGWQSRKRREARVLARSASEPALWYGARVHPVPQGLSPPSPPLERPHTCYDIFSPDSSFGRSTSTSASSSLPNRNIWEEAKVVVNVTVEGSAGPVKAMVRLGASIREAIAAVVERYDREGRSPRLDPAAAEAFQLHHSHFCLQRLLLPCSLVMATRLVFGMIGGWMAWHQKTLPQICLSLQEESNGLCAPNSEMACGSVRSGRFYHNSD